MNCDQVPAESRDDTMMFCDESPSLDASMNARGLRKIASLGYGSYYLLDFIIFLGMEMDVTHNWSLCRTLLLNNRYVQIIE